MKAKEMAALYKANPTDETLREILFQEITGTRKLALLRGVKTNDALRAILVETNDRWQAFARLCPEVNPNAFKIVLHATVPSSKNILP